MINIIGLGYIGLPTALVFAKSGIDVVGTDLNEKLVDSLSKGKLTFEEDGLEDLFNAALNNGIKFTTDYQKTDTYIIAVPTPYINTSKKLDPKYVISAINTVLDVCEKGSVLIIESTISPGSINKYIRLEIEKRGFVIGQDVHLIHAPERIIPGNMIYELVHNSRTIGADNLEIYEKVKGLYSSFCKAEIVVTDIRTTEMTKVVEYRNTDSFMIERKKYPKYLLLHVGQLIKRKGIIQVIKALDISGDKGIGFFIVGSGPEEKKLEKFRKEKNIKNVFFEGFKQQEELIKYYALADVFILPSFAEVWGLVVNEALASGLYVLSSKYAGAGYDLIREGWNEESFEPNNIGEIIELIK